MLLQDFDALTGDAIIGISLAFGLALVFTVLTFKTISAFLAWLTVFIAFVVWGGLLPLWALIINLVILTLVMFMEIKNKGGVVAE